jgi:hypothetical protein
VRHWLPAALGCGFLGVALRRRDSFFLVLLAGLGWESEEEEGNGRQIGT